MSKKYFQYYKSAQFQKILECISSDEADNSKLELRAMAALQLNDFNSARQDFKKLLSRDKRTSHSYHMGLCLMNLGDSLSAIPFYKECLENEQFKLASVINLSHCYFKTNQSHKAIKSLEKLLENNNSIKPAHYLLIEYYKKQKDIDNLKKQLLKAFLYCQNEYDWQKNQCYLLYYQRKHEELHRYIEENDIRSKEIQNILGKSFSQINEFEKAVEVYTHILNSGNNEALQWYNLAAAYSNLTSDLDLQKSLQASHHCLSEDNKYDKAHYCRALVFEKLKDFENALLEIKKAISINANCPEYLYKQAELINLEGRPQDSIDQLNSIINDFPKYNLAQRLKGIIELQQNKPVQSEQTLAKALNADDKDQRSLAYFAIAKLAQNKIQEMEEFLALGHFVKEFKFETGSEYQNLYSFNRDFEKDIKNHSLLRREPNGLAARNGFLTDNIFRDNTKSIILFRKLLEQKIQQYIKELPDDLNHHMLRHKTNEYSINSWATWVQGDGFIDKHIHEESWISGAYYCKVPEITAVTPEKEGYFEYGCIPDDIKLDIDKKRGYIKPVEGKLVIFPSYLYHQTIPHITSEDRISIAFDLTPLCWKK